MTRYRVTVEFEQDLYEFESPEDFVEACLNGNRSNSFGRAIDILEAEAVDTDTFDNSRNQK